MKPIKSPSLLEDIQYPIVILAVSLLLLLTLQNTFNSVVVISDQKLVEDVKKKQTDWIDFIQSYAAWARGVLDEHFSKPQVLSSSQVKPVQTNFSKVAVDKVLHHQSQTQERDVVDHHKPLDSTMSLAVAKTPSVKNNNSLQLAPTEYAQIPKNLDTTISELFHPSLANSIDGQRLDGGIVIENGVININVAIQDAGDVGDVDFVNSEIEENQVPKQQLPYSEIIVSSAVMLGESGLFNYRDQHSSESEQQINYSGSIFSSGAPGSYILSFENGPYQGLRLMFGNQTTEQGQDHGHDDYDMESDANSSNLSNYADDLRKKSFIQPSDENNNLKEIKEVGDDIGDIEDQIISERSDQSEEVYKSTGDLSELAKELVQQQLKEQES